MIRVMIADDQAMVRTGFGMIIGAQPDMEVVGEAADGVEAVAAGPPAAAGRGAVRHPDAPDGRPGGAAAAGRAGRRRPGQGGRGDHLRPRRVRAPGAAQRRGRLPAQGLRPGAAGRGGPRGGLRRRADQPVDHRTAAGAPVPAGADRRRRRPVPARAGRGEAGRPRPDQRGDRRPSCSSRSARSRPTWAASRPSWAPATGSRSPPGPGNAAWCPSSVSAGRSP